MNIDPLRGPDPLGMPQGVEHKAFVKAREFANDGTASSAHGITVDRPYELISKGEEGYFYILDFCQGLLDIREGYPLFSHEAAQATFATGGELLRAEVMTIDFLLTRDTVPVSYAGRSYKPSGKLHSKSQVAGLLRQQAVFRQLGWGWKLVTERNLSPIVADNAYQLSHWFRDSAAARDPAIVDSARQLTLKMPTALTFQHVIDRVSKRMGIDESASRAAICAAIRGRTLEIDWHQPIALLRPLPLKIRSKT
jgi:hypothetical protein